jgi:rubrerythrin
MNEYLNKNATKGTTFMQNQKSLETEFNPQEFVDYFVKNYARPRVSNQIATEDLPVSTTLPPLKEKVLNELLLKLAFGEKTEGNMGRRLNRLAKTETDRESLKWYVREEERHGEEFLWLVKQLNLSNKTQVSKAAIFAANLFNVGRLIDVANLILVGEVILTPFYQDFAKHTTVPLLRETMANIMRDEAGHIRYHGARVRAAFHKTNIFGRLLLIIGHKLGLVAILLSLYFVLWPDLKLLTELSWSEVLAHLESNYQKFFKGDFASFRSRWIFRLAYLLP